ncbi:Hypothetical protein CINCED_3A018119 [Cinara cedri]|uniref:Uncharacterized protein n=1 Tax=Cinara cedri TaxID=506608 RepID=A0A5E4NL11_9HEMI|nr:Hypothetical protein CINCED_3A018119 [Cinara cedri]
MSSIRIISARTQQYLIAVDDVWENSHTAVVRRSGDHDHRDRDLRDSAVTTEGRFVDRKDALPPGFSKFPRFAHYASSAMCSTHRDELRCADSHILHKTDAVSSAAVHDKMHGNFSTALHHTLHRDFSAAVYDKMYGDFSTALHHTPHRDYWAAMHDEMYREYKCQ